jgi:nitroreductase
MSILDAVGRRRSHAKVTAEAPSHDELLPLVEAAGRVADHGSLRPWRLVELRGDARRRLGEAFVAASDLDGIAAATLAAKPLRAELLLAVVSSHRQSFTVERWEQDAVASGVGHILSLLLDEAGWGVMWRTGPLTRTQAVRQLHRLADNEELLGWLYIGGRSADSRPAPAKPIVASDFLTQL